MDVTVKIPKEDNRKYTGFAFTYRYKKSDDRCAYFIEGKITKKLFGTYLSASIDMSKLDLKRVIWDLYATFEEDGRRYGASISITDKQIEKVLYDKRELKSKLIVQSKQMKVRMLFSLITHLSIQLLLI